MDFNTSYLNRTPNKHERTEPAHLVGIVLHETAGFGTLEWNLKPDVKASFNYLILQNGAIYHYVDEQAFIAWHAGIRSVWTINGVRYSGADFNDQYVGIEFEGANNVTPITTAQRDSLIALLHYLNQRYDIPLDVEHCPEHSQIAPGYKSDAQGFSNAVILELATKTINRDVLPDVTVIGGEPMITVTQFIASMQRHKAPLSVIEMERVYRLAMWLQIEPSFLIALWKHEGGSPFGSSELQQQTFNPLNIKAPATEWRTIVQSNGVAFYWYESFQLGLFAGVLHLKNHYGARGLTTVREILPVFAPARDGNNVEAYIRSVLEDIAYIKNR
mgnify:CR=1 FL=1